MEGKHSAFQKTRPRHGSGTGADAAQFAARPEMAAYVAHYIVGSSLKSTVPGTDKKAGTGVQFAQDHRRVGIKALGSQNLLYRLRR